MAGCDHLFSVMATMDHEPLLEEWNRLLDSGEHLLTAFPRHASYDWLLLLPNNISDEMEWYADAVSKRSWDKAQSQKFWPNYSTSDLAWLVKKLEEGLLGWRAIGVLPQIGT